MNNKNENENEKVEKVNIFEGVDFLNRHYTHKFLPFYDEQTDFSTNAKSYYDYLARVNMQLKIIVDYLNNIGIVDGGVPNLNPIETNTLLFAVNNIENVLNVGGEVKLSNQTTLFNDKQVGNMLRILSGSTSEQQGLYVPDLRDEILNLINSVDGLRNRTDTIIKLVNDIEGIINISLKREFVKLTKGIDYEIEWHNNFYTESTDLEVEVLENRKNKTLEYHIYTDSGTKKILKNDSIGISAKPSNTPFTKPSNSFIFTLKPKGVYKDYLRSIKEINTIPTLWNIAPSNSRASWTSYTDVELANPDSILVTWRSYADGHNSGLQVYDNYQNFNLDNGNLNIKFLTELNFL